MRMLLGSKRYLKFKVKTWLLDIVFHWTTSGADELDGPFLFLSSCISMPDYGIRGRSKTMFFSGGEQGIFKWEGGTKDKKKVQFYSVFH